MRALLLALVLLLLPSCGLFQKDCSIHPYPSPKACQCIRNNDDWDRALICNKELFEVTRSKRKQECIRKCFRVDCSYCDEV